MEYWELGLVIVGAIFFIIKVTEFCQSAGKKDAESRPDEESTRTSNLYIIEEDFIIIDTPELGVDGAPPPYTFPMNGPPPPAYEAPPPYNEIVPNESQ